MLQGIIENRGHFNLNDLGVMAEDFFAGLLNFAYALELKNLNQSGANYAAIDLGDEKKRTAFQITAESKKSKVQETLDGFVAAGLDKEFDSLRILMMSDRQRKYPGLNVPKKLDFDEMADGSAPKIAYSYRFLSDVYAYEFLGPKEAVAVAVSVPWAELVVGMALVSQLLQRGAPSRTPAWSVRPAGDVAFHSECSRGVGGGVEL